MTTTLTLDFRPSAPALLPTRGNKETPLSHPRSKVKLYPAPFPALVSPMNETLLGGRYEVLEAIATGGEARVFRALDTATQVQVAARLPLHLNAPAAPAALPAFHPGWVRLIE